MNTPDPGYELDPKLTARELVGDPLAGLPFDVADVMQPYFSLATKFGATFADGAVAREPLPWHEDHAAAVLDAVVASFDEMIRTSLAGLPEDVFSAMHKQLFIAFSERMDTLALAWSVPSSRSSH